jgi:hypothetical protein
LWLHNLHITDLLYFINWFQYFIAMWDTLTLFNFQSFLHWQTDKNPCIDFLVILSALEFSSFQISQRVIESRLLSSDIIASPMFEKSDINARLKLPFSYCYHIHHHIVYNMIMENFSVQEVRLRIGPLAKLIETM